MTLTHVLPTLYQRFQSSTGVSTDTRTLKTGELFFALSGPNFNGNHFALKARELGASHVVVSESIEGIEGCCTVVPDTLIALQELAKYHREKLGIPVIAITGSNGKTTTKELTHLLLSQKYDCFATKGNLNNHIGVPLSILSIRPEHKVAILELGANHLNEIAFLCQIAQPDYGVITSIGKDHLEGYGSFEGVKKGSSELLEYLNAKKKVFLHNPTDQTVGEILAPFTSLNKVLTVSGIEFDTIDSFVSLTYQGIRYPTQLIGSYNNGNIVLAISIAHLMSIPVTESLIKLYEYQAKSNRSQLVHTDRNVVVLDAYNANPSSMEESLKSFAAMGQGKKIAVLGDMAELGSFSFTEHQNIATLKVLESVDSVFFCGEEFFKVSQSVNRQMNALFFKSKAELVEYLEKNPINASKVLLKGSRSMKMEELISLL